MRDASPTDKYFVRTRTITNSDDLKCGYIKKPTVRKIFSPCFFLSFLLNRKKKRWRVIDFCHKNIDILLVISGEIRLK
jgi:hypothetical protein